MRNCKDKLNVFKDCPAVTSRKRIHGPDFVGGEDDDGGPIEFDVDKFEERARKFSDLPLLKKRSRKFDEEVAPVLVTVNLTDLFKNLFCFVLLTYCIIFQTWDL